MIETAYNDTTREEHGLICKLQTLIEMWTDFTKTSCTKAC